MKKAASANRHESMDTPLLARPARPKFLSAGGYSGLTIASFVGYAPADAPRFVMLVRIDEPRDTPWGETVAAPTFKRAASELLLYFRIPPEPTERDCTELSLLQMTLTISQLIEGLSPAEIIRRPAAENAAWAHFVTTAGRSNRVTCS